MAQLIQELCFQHKAMIPQIIHFMFSKIFVTLGIALYLSIEFNEDAKLLMLFLLAFELGSWLSYLVSIYF